MGRVASRSFAKSEDVTGDKKERVPHGCLYEIWGTAVR
jgi:hypothetical protein